VVWAGGFGGTRTQKATDETDSRGTKLIFKLALGKQKGLWSDGLFPSKN
jgi:hypothetical protein